MPDNDGPTRVPRNGGARQPGHLRRQLILDAARPLFVQFGLEGTRTKQIAEAAGVNEGLLYHYFDSKQAVFEAAVLEPLQELLDDIFSSWSTIPPDAPAEVALQKGMMETLRAMESVVPLLRVALFSDETMGRQFYRERFYPLITRHYPMLEETMVKIGQDFDPEYADAGWALVLGLSIDRWFRGKPINDPELAERLLGIFLNGFGAPSSEATGPRPGRSAATSSPKGTLAGVADRKKPAKRQGPRKG